MAAARARARPRSLVGPRRADVRGGAGREATSGRRGAAGRATPKRNARRPARGRAPRRRWGRPRTRGTRPAARRPAAAPPQETRLARACRAPPRRRTRLHPEAPAATACWPSSSLWSGVLGFGVLGLGVWGSGAWGSGVRQHLASPCSHGLLAAFSSAQYKPEGRVSSRKEAWALGVGRHNEGAEQVK